ncbi:hypothetical protein L1987_15067 [Smallanthus sonchifolius]|uniref:Uncharacterized protein n=1 Tax=Smallanthus sonchifolius TaxID=185202 RepID=A0ACB9J519_9ASTR|nr:hypothetical protein L1987_15067 [Smallanthus sonchifolius]
MLLRRPLRPGGPPFFYVLCPQGFGLVVGVIISTRFEARKRPERAPNPHPHPPPPLSSSSLLQEIARKTIS